MCIVTITARHALNATTHSFSWRSPHIPLSRTSPRKHADQAITSALGSVPKILPRFDHATPRRLYGEMDATFGLQPWSLNSSMRCFYPDVEEFVEAVIQDFVCLRSRHGSAQTANRHPPDYPLSFLGQISRLLATEDHSEWAELGGCIHSFLCHVLRRRGGRWRMLGECSIKFSLCARPFFSSTDHHLCAYLSNGESEDTMGCKASRS